MDREIPDDLIEINDPDIDPAQIVEQIRERIRRRREEAGYAQRVLPTFGATAYPGEPEGEHHDPDLYYHLQLANEIYVRTETGPILAASPATRLPILGRLWQSVRGHAHSLVLFYVNRAATHQTDVNRHLVSTLNQLAVVSQEQQQRIRELESQVDRLCAERTGKD